MANEQEERVSALVDDEFEPRQLDALLAQMRKDDTLRDRWARYHLISDALHNNLTPSVELDISHKVSAALEEEAVIFAPLWQRLRPSRRLVKQATGVAVAASVTAVAILGAQWNSRQEQIAVMAANGNTAAIPIQVAQQPDIEAQPKEEVWIRNLDSYVVNHNEYSGSTTMHGVLPYARLVGYESQQ